MKWDDFEGRMRVYETAHDHTVLPGMYMVARLDGRGFTRLTKADEDFERPFDERFRDLMMVTVEHLMTEVGPRFAFAYTQSDEMSLLFHPEDDSFGRKLRKLNSVLAGEASARFTHGLGRVACFDCRVSQLPSRDHVIDYFRLRSEDGHRNAVGAHCYWRLRDDDGLDARAATLRLQGLSVAERNEFLFARGVNVNDLPAWQKRGVGFTWADVVVEGCDPRTGATTRTTRRRLQPNLELPKGEAFVDLVRAQLETAAG